LSICYYHQDLRQWKLQLDSRPRLRSNHRGPPTRYSKALDNAQADNGQEKVSRSSAIHFQG